MSWEARTNTGKMQKGAIFIVIETPQGDNHRASHPPAGTPITVYLTLNGPAIPGLVAAATAFTMSWDIHNGSLWDLEPWKPSDGFRPPAPSGMTGTYWTVV